MSAKSDVYLAYKELLAAPKDTAAMLILADALDDAGASQLAAAYRWAAENGRWPFVRHTNRGRRGRSNQRPVYDWDVEGRKFNPAPAECQLPRKLFDAIRAQKDRRYGGVSRAFILLARALAGVNAP